ncbi:MAG: cytochrome c biogenesis protein CcsA [Bacteroidales bacterium]|nr:cytochrome c biogenesis protein CcsA [Bacteroidales bacterium]
MKLTKYLSYCAMAALIVMMMAATFVEKFSGNAAAFRWVYHNPLFLVLWAMTAVCGLIFLIRRGTPRKLFTMGIHAALAVILSGALVTYLSGTSGSIHLREGETSSAFEMEDESPATLPFRIRLDSFAIDYHPGSKMPSDYSSDVVFLPEGKAVHISMNNIGKYKGYRFYQADYDEDGKGSILAVSHDPWGVGITYAGYLLLLISMIGFFSEKDTAFRAALRRVASFTAAVALFALLPSQSASARPVDVQEGISTAEQLYVSVGLPRVQAMVCLTLGIVLFVAGLVLISKKRKYPAWVLTAGAVVALLMWLYLTLVIGLRWYVSGTGPYVGRYNVMMLMAWFATLAVLLLYRRFPLIQPLGFLLSGFTMLLASRDGAGLQITPLMPVLQSPLLSLHVLSMMMSYTLFGLVAFNGIMGVAVPSREVSEKLMDVSLVVLYPAVFLLTSGTFLGAVWANISWGSYWAWDPKETWALVTLLVYSFTLHGGALKPFRSARFFHWYTIGAFLCVLITYFGVNLILGGMHSYA